ncbi:hypothetical protein PR003_g16342 [Phytophthora rubi]|uniref:Uncharacterized protein n=1 Tax=Phytophthora rubi TaxID=129364 RepID=A0A6A4ELH2_9STRA|nr:hypothetical protein PR003_g16342 [Phytophthora rubi]
MSRGLREHHHENHQRPSQRDQVQFELSPHFHLRNMGTSRRHRRSSSSGRSTGRSSGSRGSSRFNISGANNSFTHLDACAANENTTNEDAASQIKTTNSTNIIPSKHTQLCAQTSTCASWTGSSSSSSSNRRSSSSRNRASNSSANFDATLANEARPPRTPPRAPTTPEPPRPSAG